jgi:hypothetical protein
VTPAQESQGCSVAELAAINVAERIPAPAPRELPPYNGFGSLEDSAQSCRSLIPQVRQAYCLCRTIYLLPLHQASLCACALDGRAVHSAVSATCTACLLRDATAWAADSIGEQGGSR